MKWNHGVEGSTPPDAPPRTARWRSRTLAAVAALSAVGLSGFAASGTAAEAATPPALAATTAAPDSYNGLAATPPMGFNDWNAFGCNVSAQLIESTALAMHNNGMQAAGYDYVNIDDCWMLGRDPSEIPAGQTKATVGRGADGHLIVDPNYFPPSAPGLNDGIKVVADYVHSLGMKLGLYEEAGTATCQGLAGSYGHETTDAADFASWGVDYLKYDNCNIPAGTGDTQQEYIDRYKAMSDALAATGRPIVYALCEWGNFSPWVWGPDQANLGRSTADIRPNFASMLSNFTINAENPPAAGGPLYFNDPDMLEIGTGTMTSLAGAASAGDSTILVSSVSTAIVGSPITIGTAAAGNLESDTVAAVGTAAGNTLLAAPAASGDTNVKLGNVSSFVVGKQATVGTQTVTVTGVGTSAVATTLSAATTAGATTLKVGSVANLAVGDTLLVDSGANVESVTLTAVGTSGTGGTGVTVSPALAVAHARAASVIDTAQPGTGVTFTPALTSAYPVGSAAHGPGSGLTLAQPLALAHASGDHVGIAGMTDTESKTEFSLWAVEAAPLIVGTDVVNIAAPNLAIYENRDVIAVDQDPLGVQASVIDNTGGHWTLEKPLANGDTAVALFNAGSTDWTGVSVSLASLGLSGTYAARDLWTKSVSAISDSIDVPSIPAHGTVILRLSKSCTTTAQGGSLQVGAGQSVCVADGGRINGSVSVASGGELWVDHGSISGPVTVASGGELFLNGATVNGPVTSSAAGAATITGTHIAGPVTVSASAGVLVFSGNTLSGPVSITSNTDGVTFTGNTVKAPLTIQHNRGGFSYGDNSVSGPTSVSDNS